MNQKAELVTGAPEAPASFEKYREKLRRLKLLKGRFLSAEERRLQLWRAYFQAKKDAEAARDDVIKEI